MDLVDLVISLSPCLMLAILGAVKGWKNQQGRLIIGWIAVSLILIFIPWNLQRRFLTGIYVPLAGLSVFGVEAIIEKTSIKFRTVIFILVCLILPTNIVVILSGIQAASIQDQKIYISSAISEGLDWIKGNSEQDAVVLASGDNGLFIPSMTGRRTVYGHPFETIDAEKERIFVENFFQGDLSAEMSQDNLDLKGVDYIFYEVDLTQDFSGRMRVMGNPLVFSNGKVEIYTVTQP